MTAETLQFREAVEGLLRGDFSRSAPLFEGEPCPILAWVEQGHFENEPAALAEALSCACFLGRTSVAAALMEKGVDPLAGAATGLNAFHWAANRGQLATVRLLIEKKVPLEVKNMYGGTVLGTAVWSAVYEPRPDHDAIIDELVAAGARPDAIGHPSGDPRAEEVLRRHRAPRCLPIATNGIVLRPFRDADLDVLIAYRNDPEVARYQDWEGISREDALALVRAHTQDRLGTPGRWQQIAISLAPGVELIGDIGLFVRADGRSAELGFTLARRYQGRGLAREALAGLIDALFREAGLGRLEAVTDARNGAAMALLARLGFGIASTAEAMFKGSACLEHTYVLEAVPR